jgi:hypothetical protein
MRSVIGIAVIILLAGCSKPSSPNENGKAEAAASDSFPQKGNYHVVHDLMQGSENKREEFDLWLDVSDRGKFAGQLAKDDGTNCRDKDVAIGGGSFSVHMTCDAPDGDIHNIGIDRRGTYSADSIDATAETVLWGTPMRESYSYRLKAN